MQLLAQKENSGPNTTPQQFQNKHSDPYFSYDFHLTSPSLGRKSFFLNSIGGKCESHIISRAILNNMVARLFFVWSYINQKDPAPSWINNDQSLIF